MKVTDAAALAKLAALLAPTLRRVEPKKKALAEASAEVVKKTEATGDGAPIAA